VAWYHRLLNIVLSNRLSTDIEREVNFHIAERADDLRAAGLSDHEAADQARRRFGNAGLYREQIRDADLFGWLDTTVGDFRYAWRALRRSPAFAIAAVGSIALGIGANVAIYALIDAVSLRALPVPHPEELLQVGVAQKGEGGFVGVQPNDERFSNPLWEALRDGPNGFANVAAFGNLRVNLADEGEARFLTGAFVSGNYFRLFGVKPAAGRLFAQQEDVRGCAPVVVISDAYWTSEFSRDAHVLGRKISFDGKPFQIIGVAGGRFTGPVVGVMPRFYVPLCAEPVLRGPRSRLDSRSDWWLTVIGRRAADADPRQIAARLQGFGPTAYEATLDPRAGAEQRQSYLSKTFSLGDISRGVSPLHASFNRALLTLMAFVALVMLIACANVANLLLARAATRRRELALRLALGAARGRIARQLLTESGLLALLGAVGGLVFARWGASMLVGMISLPQGPVELDLSLNPRLLAFTAFVATATAVLFGVVPAWRGTRLAPQTAMNDSGRNVAEGHRGFTVGKALVGAQVALSLVLLVGAALLVGSLRKLSTEDAGFHAGGVLIVKADLRRSGVSTEQMAAVNASLLEGLRAIPAVVDVSQSQVVPVSRDRWNDVVVVDGFTPQDPDDAQIWFNRVSPRYFATLRTRFLLGRDFDDRDVPTAERVAIVNDAFARRFFRTLNATGRQFRTRVGDTASAPITVVGVVENAKYESLREEPGPIAYLAMSQGKPTPTITAEVRTSGDALALVPAVRLAVGRVNPRIVLEIETLVNQLASSLSRERLLALLSAVFGTVALLLATLGLYGITAYSVAQRTKEIGVRQALGAGRGRIIRMVLGDVSRTVIAGTVVGAVATRWAGKLVSALLFHMQPSDPVVLAAAATLLVLIALAAGLIPALRASRIDPVAALRE